MTWREVRKRITDSLSRIRAAIFFEGGEDKRPESYRGKRMLVFLDTALAVDCLRGESVSQGAMVWKPTIRSYRRHQVY